MRLLRWIYRAPIRLVSYLIAALLSRDPTPGEVEDERPVRER